MIRNFLLVGILLACVTTPAFTQATTTRETAIRAQALEAAKAYIQDFDVPGLSVAVLKGGRTLVSDGVGLRDVKRKLPVTERTTFRLASISKSVTAVLLMRLVDQKKIDLDAPVAKYVEGFPKKRWVPTVRQLASHLSGIRHYRGPADPTTNVQRRFERCSEAMKLFVNDPLLHEPGSKFSYSTHAFTVLGAVLESASGKPFNELLAREIKQHFKLATPRVERDLPAGAEPSKLYQPRSDREARADDLSWKEPGGGMVATARDLARFGLQVLRGAYLTKGSREAMWTGAKDASGKPTRYGLGWRVATVRERRYVAHSGSQIGAASFLSIYPEEGVVIAILSNCTGHRAVRLERALARLVLP